LNPFSSELKIVLHRLIHVQWDDYYYYQKDENNTLRWTYSISGINEATLAVNGLSATNEVSSWHFYNDSTHYHKYLTDKRADFTKDFKASTIGVKTQCTPMTQRCFPNVQGFYLGDNYTFHCGEQFTGELTSNGASLATGLRTTSLVSTGIGFSPDPRLSRMVGNSENSSEFAAYTNPLYFGAWNIGSKSLPAEDIDTGSITYDDWDQDDNFFYDENNYYAWMLNCSSTSYYVDYTWINGTVHDFWLTTAEPLMGGIQSYPFVSGLPIARLCTEFAASRVTKANDSITVANWYAEYFSICAVQLMAGVLDPTVTHFEQTRNNNFVATRVPIVPLFVLLGFKLLYCLAVLGLAIAAYHYTNPAESQSVKERLTVKGLAATYFTDSPSDQQVAVKNIEQLFQPPQPSSPEAAKDAEAAPPPEPKLAMVQTEMGGWQFVKVAAGKVYNTVAPIVERQLLGDATAGNFGSDGREAAQWISLVRK
jgi:hypothetical protein